MPFEISMIREKMIILEENPPPDREEITVLRSNRAGLELKIPKLGTEFLTIRGQNMHCTLRMTARVLQQHYRDGALVSGKYVFNGWDELWDQCLTKYEREHNPDNWITVFGNGKVMYTTQPSIYMEVLEKCDHVNKGNYDAAVEFAEKALKEIGRPVKIEHDATLAVIITESAKEVKSSIIQRAGGADTTFSFLTSGGASAEERLVRSIFMAASWLEGINLGFFIADIKDRMNAKEVRQKSEEGERMNAAIKRRNSIVREVDRFEQSFTVRYRPDRPDLFKDT